MIGRLGNSNNLLLTIQKKIEWVDNMSEVDRHHKKEVENKVEEMWKTIKVSDIMISLQ
jgi:COP9 signalosome complex subunit 7